MKLGFFVTLFSAGAVQAHVSSILFKDHVEISKPQLQLKDLIESHSLIGADQDLNTSILSVESEPSLEDSFEWSERDVVQKLKPVLKGLRDKHADTPLQIKFPKKISFLVNHRFKQSQVVRAQLLKELKSICTRCDFDLKTIQLSRASFQPGKDMTLSFNREKIQSLLFPFKDQVQIPFLAKAGDKVHYLNATVHWAVSIQCPIANRDLKAGERIRAQDIEWTKKTIDTTLSGSLNPCSFDIDRTYQASRSKKKGEFLLATDLIDAPLVQSGQWVRYLIKVGALEATLEGIAQNGGRIGETIRVRFPRTQRVIFAKIQDENTVVPR